MFSPSCRFIDVIFCKKVLQFFIAIVTTLCILRFRTAKLPIIHCVYPNQNCDWSLNQCIMLHKNCGLLSFPLPLHSMGKVQPLPLQKKQHLPQKPSFMKIIPCLLFYYKNENTISVRVGMLP